MRKRDVDKPTCDNAQVRPATPEAERTATAEELKHAADRAIERNREALTELAKW